MTVAKPLKRYLAMRACVGPGLDVEEDVLLEVDGEGFLSDVRPKSQVSDAIRLEGVVCPGFVDCHVHLVLSGEISVLADLEYLTPPTATLVALRNARAHLAHGVTLVRDVGAPWDVAVHLSRLVSPVPLPRIVAAGAVTNAGGHGHYFARIADGPDEVRRQVREVIASGATWVKVFATGGVMTPGSPPSARQFHDDELEMAVQTAHTAGVRIAAHAHGNEGVMAAIAAGVDSVEHLSYADPHAIDRLRMTQTMAVSTSVATRRMVRSLDVEPMPSADMVAKIREHERQEQPILPALVSSGLPFAVGTDAGSTHNPHGNGLQEQAALMHEAGMKPKDILRALTVHGAELLHLPAGQLAVGRWADWVLLEDDPVQDLGTLCRIREVFLNGRPISALR